MGKLVLFLKDATPVEIPLVKERVTIGRRPDNDVCLPYPAVSGEHAAVVTILADSFLEDLGSTNGTLVNGRPVAKHFLRDRDQVDIGRQLIVYLADDGARAEPPPAIAGRDDRRELAGRVDGMADPGRVEPALASAIDADLGAVLSRLGVEAAPLGRLGAGRAGHRRPGLPRGHAGKPAGVPGGLRSGALLGPAVGRGPGLRRSVGGRADSRRCARHAPQHPPRRRLAAGFHPPLFGQRAKRAGRGAFPATGPIR